MHFDNYIQWRLSGHEVGIADPVVVGAGVFKGFCSG